MVSPSLGYTVGQSIGSESASKSSEGDSAPLPLLGWQVEVLSGALSTETQHG